MYSLECTAEEFYLLGIAQAHYDKTLERKINEKTDELKSLPAHGYETDMTSLWLSYLDRLQESNQRIFDEKIQPIMDRAKTLKDEFICNLGYVEELNILQSALNAFEKHIEAPEYNDEKYRQRVRPLIESVNEKLARF